MRSRRAPLTLIVVLPAIFLNIIPDCGGCSGGGGGGGSTGTEFEVEPNEGINLSNPLTAGRPMQGDVSTIGDIDWFSFHIIKGQTIKAELYGTRLDQATWDASGTVPRLTVFFPDDVTKLMEHSFLSGWPGGAQDFEIPMFHAKTTGTYWFVVQPDDELVGGGRYALRVSLASPVPSQFEIEEDLETGVDDTPGTAQPITPGLLAGYHKLGNDDFYSVTVTGPRVLRFELLSQRNGAWGGSTSIYDPLMRLYGTDGATVLATNDDAFFHDPAIQYAVSVAGDYRIQVTENPGNLSGAPYFLKVSSDPATTLTEIEPNNTPPGADPFAYGDAMSGSAAPGTVDWFQFVGTAGDMVRLQVFDKNNSDSASEALDVALFASDGTTPIPFHEGPAFQVLTTILQTSGTCYVRAQTAAGAVGATNYRLELSRFLSAIYETEPNDTIAVAPAFPGSGQVAGVIATAGDRDLYHFTAPSRSLVSFVVYADATATGSDGFSEYSGHGSDLDPLLTIRDDAGAPMTVSTSQPVGLDFTEGIIDGLPTATVTFVATPTSSSYFIEVTAADGSGGPNHTYVLRRR
ncbi:MAG TPA: hypothetical protein VGR31_05870 [Planctomycetota bacterium]|jgi:hypothetical protein|nr:hypothetical protein [Planctomycetota bacterium]